MKICLATGSDNINSAIFYVNGVSHAFDNLKNSEFLWAKNSKMNFLLDKRLEYGGKIFMTLFTIIEDAGGVLYNLEQNKELRKKCFEQCDLYTSSNVISLKCQVCSKKKDNNVNMISNKECVRFCKFRFLQSLTNSN